MSYTGINGTFTEAGLPKRENSREHALSVRTSELRTLYPGFTAIFLCTGFSIISSPDDIHLNQAPPVLLKANNNYSFFHGVETRQAIVMRKG
jgi:hypothetical protein